MKNKDFDELSEEHFRKMQTKCRRQLRQVIENTGAECDCEGAVTQYIVIAEFRTRDDDGDVISTLWLDHSACDDSPLPPWALRGLLSETLMRIGDVYD